MWPTARLIDRTLHETPHQQNDHRMAEVKSAKVEHLRLTQELERERSRLQEYRTSSRTRATMFKEDYNQLVQKVRAVIKDVLILRSWCLYCPHASYYSHDQVNIACTPFRRTCCPIHQPNRPPSNLILLRHHNIITHNFPTVE